MKTLRILLGRLLILSTSVALSGWEGAGHAGMLFSDGDFDAQVVGQPVGAPWGPVGGGLVTMTAQSPYANVYPGNGKGVNFPATTDNLYIVRAFPENAIPPDSAATFYFNVDFRNNSAETGDYSIVITRDASGGLRSVALYVTGGTLYAEGQTGFQAIRALQPGTWYNLQLVLDMATRTYSGSVSTPGEFTAIPSRPFVQTGVAINSVYTDGGTSIMGGPSPDHDMDNWALSDTPLAPLGAPTGRPTWASPSAGPATSPGKRPTSFS